MEKQQLLDSKLCKNWKEKVIKPIREKIERYLESLKIQNNKEDYSINHNESILLKNTFNRFKNQEINESFADLKKECEETNFNFTEINEKTVNFDNKTVNFGNKKFDFFSDKELLSSIRKESLEKSPVRESFLDTSLYGMDKTEEKIKIKNEEEKFLPKVQTKNFSENSNFTKKFSTKRNKIYQKAIDYQKSRVLRNNSSFDSKNYVPKTFIPQIDGNADDLNDWKCPEGFDKPEWVEDPKFMLNVTEQDNAEMFVYFSANKNEVNIEDMFPGREWANNNSPSRLPENFRRK